MSSDEEKKIWGELERDVERELEEEIKDGICKLALRLHRLYRDQKQRNNNNNNNNNDNNYAANLDDSKTLSEVSINIRMEGGTKIEIKEIKKEGRRRRSSSTRGGAITAAPPPQRGQKFDWHNSLRSGPSHYPTGYNKHIEKNNATASIQRKNKNLGLINALELGWKP